MNRSAATTTQVITEVWLTRNGDRVHVRPDCQALIDGQEAAPKQGYIVWPPAPCPANLGLRTHGFLTGRRTPCQVCWKAEMEAAATDSPEALAAFADAPLRAKARAEDASRERSATIAAESLAKRHDFTDLQQRLARQLIRQSWFDDREAGVHKLTADEIVKLVTES